MIFSGHLDVGAGFHVGGNGFEEIFVSAPSFADELDVGDVQSGVIVFVVWSPAI